MAEAVSRHDEIPAGDRKKAVVAAVFGNFVEWYDFTVYGVFAATIATLFFPEGDRFAALLSTFAVFGVAFLIRPVGALVIGSYGDRLGRRGTLSLVILLMSGATFLIGVAPTYAQVGVLAPLVLVFARLLQGFSAGGEFGGATSFMVEYAPEGKRGLYASWQATSQACALLVGLSLGAALSTLPEEQFLAWGWRIPFLVALPLGLVGLYMRLRLEETPSFRAVLESREVESAPLRETLRSHGGDILKVIGMILVYTVLTYLFVFSPTYLQEARGLSRGQALGATAAGMVVYAVLCPFAALVSERVGRKPFLAGGALIGLLFAFPGFLLFQGSYPAVILAEVVFGLCLGLFGGAYASAFSELFPTRVRYSALSISYSVSVSVFGGTAPLIFTYLLQRTGNPISPAYYVAVTAAVSLVAALSVRETAKMPLRDV